MRILRGMAGAVLASTIATAAAGAQINYSTQGFFSGPGTTAAGVTCTTASALSASCSGGGFNLLFTGTAGINLASGTITSLGTFSLTGTGTVTVPSGAIFFTLLVNQTTPSPGQGTFLGSISGSVSAGATNSSSLIWTPNQFATIDGVHYQMIFDNVGPAANTGLGIPIDHSRGIDALVTTTTTPEPATVTLMVTGLAGLVPVVIRRRKSGSST
jgi:hypothetical protein